jgi:O-antigen ligase
VSAARGEKHRRQSKVTFHPFLVANLGFLVLALLVGGASRENALQVGFVELAGLILLPWALMRLAVATQLKPLILPGLIIAGAVLVPLIQLVPLPPEVWTAMPGGDRVAAIYRAAQIPLNWRPLSLVPGLTLHSALALIVPITVFLSWLTLTSSERKLGLIAILAAVLAGLMLGVVQMAGGGQTTGYLYQNTNLGSLVGFFSNRNHEASLLLCTLPIAAALMAKSDSRKIRGAVFAIVGLGVAIAIILALAAVRSRAGILLAGPVLLASFAVALSSSQTRFSRNGIILAAIILCAIAIIVPFGLGPILARFETSLVDDLRFAVAPDIWQAARGYFPWGSGLGSFDNVYRTFEHLNRVSYEFLNHAHDDYLELALEVGALAIIPLLLFGAWWLIQTRSIWLSREPMDRAYSRAAWTMVTILLIHSAFDYPLRTLALASLFGFSCALMMRSLRSR